MTLRPHPPPPACYKRLAARHWERRMEADSDRLRLHPGTETTDPTQTSSSEQSSAQERILKKKQKTGLTLHLAR